ncbi:DUF6879 family protein [Streptomyces sp. NPDC005435]|uniref:DUF6879 family protein n=1 Tax=Streptomyces sp. NPDC005435 TaxID=3154464 RepID=UPI003456ABF3
MARQLRFTGTDSKVDGRPALHADEGTGEIIVQGTPVTDPEDLAQLQHLGPNDAAVAVPRELLVNWGPKETERVPEIVDRDTFRRLFQRYLWREDAERTALPAEDFWIFDPRLVALLHFDDDDNLLNIELTTEPAEVVRYCVVRDAAMHHAVPRDEFAAQVAPNE